MPGVKFHQISKKDLRDVLEAVRAFGCSAPEGERAFKVYSSSAEIYIVGSTPILIVVLNTGERIPSIQALNKGLCSPAHVKVDQGAVPRILNGADVMAPGIIEASTFGQGELVGVKEPQRGAFIAVGRALMSSEEIVSLRRGRAVKNLHHVGDGVWNAIAEALLKIR